jgi:hypothetical protein
MRIVVDDIAERAVRNYLLFLEDPQQLIDQDQIESLQSSAQQAADPIERLRIYAQLERAENSDESRYRLEFILHATAWAATNDVGPAAFRRAGVSDEVLSAAGLVAGRAGAAKNARKRQPVPARRSVSAESIKHHVRLLRGTFTLADVQSSVGGSQMTVRKGVQALVDDGTVTRLGPMPDWSGRGRAPIVFKVEKMERQRASVDGCPTTGLSDR